IVKITVRTTNGAARRRRQAKGIVAEYAAWSTAFGLLPIPFADMAGISATQVSMVAELSKFYNVPFSRHWIRTILGAIAGGVAPWGVTTGVVSLLKSMPGLGVGIRLAGMAGLSNLATRALGNLFISHFENGGDLSNVDTAAMRTALNGDLK
ncbi:MAG: YcjF family protein, partial [Rhodospirillaceae bacterium]|nr:YcjF family protein [Rhodospirillaceae bacterium]